MDMGRVGREGRLHGLFILKKKKKPSKNCDLLPDLAFSMPLSLSLIYIQRYTVGGLEAYECREIEEQGERLADDIMPYVLVRYLSVASATNTDRHTFARTHTLTLSFSVHIATRRWLQFCHQTPPGGEETKEKRGVDSNEIRLARKGKKATQ